MNPCVFCGAPTTGQGEHIFPRWFLRRLKGPFTFEVNGETVTGKGGGRFQQDPLPPELLPVCPQDNEAWLNNKFERGGRAAIERCLDNLQPLGAVETADLGAWLVKTVLLCSHPDARRTIQAPHPRLRSRLINAPHPGDGAWRALFSQWRSTDQFPDDLSLWVAVLDPSGQHLPEATSISVPDTERSDGAGGTALVGKPLGLGIANGQVLQVQLVRHPLADVEHPFEIAGLATRLWPNPPASFDITSHPKLDEMGYEQFSGLFHPSGGGLVLERGRRLTLRAGQQDPWEMLGYVEAE